jgi:DNA-binding CsgD family transcriptional regulator
VLLAAGRPDEARADAAAALAMAGESGAGEAVSRAAHSVVRRTEAQAGDTAGPWPGVPLVDPADDPAAVRAALRAGRSRDAAAAVAEAERRAALNPGVPFFAAVAAHARGLLDDDPEPIQHAIRLLDGIARPLSLASALEDAGRKLLESDRDAAIAHLTRAEDGYSRTGAESGAARVRRRLRAAGHRGRTRARRRGAARGWPALTPAELRVASRVAEGATNRQVAEKLFLSPATVGTHVMHVFRKLGVNSRVELARVYHEHGEAVG